mmetsp:Transcript_19210/g.26583  ORF Transcript_19210/g.26583 Transcript_19210/m.26583 type:complete len:166 (-) Transcript_19210:219-716(-)
MRRQLEVAELEQGRLERAEGKAARLAGVDARLAGLEMERDTLKAERDRGVAAEVQAVEELRMVQEEAEMKDFQNELMMEQLGARETDLSKKDEEIVQCHAHITKLTEDVYSYQHALKKFQEESQALKDMSSIMQKFEKEREALLQELLEKEGTIDILRERIGGHL